MPNFYDVDAGLLHLRDGVVAQLTSDVMAAPLRCHGEDVDLAMPRLRADRPLHVSDDGSVYVADGDVSTHLGCVQRGTSSQ